MTPVLHVILLAMLSVTFGSSSQKASEELSRALAKTDTVTFYFISAIDQRRAPLGVLKKGASVKVIRDCGSNCRNFMREVINHLKSAVRTDCKHGRINLLIQTDNGIELWYSYSGRSIMVNDKCYFNKNSIETIVKKSAFLFN